ncbi:hypothetical protein ACF0H5_009326 [Mactra antiquata]
MDTRSDLKLGHEDYEEPDAVSRQPSIGYRKPPPPPTNFTQEDYEDLDGPNIKSHIDTEQVLVDFSILLYSDLSYYSFYNLVDFLCAGLKNRWYYVMMLSACPWTVACPDKNSTRAVPRFTKCYLRIALGQG